MGKYSQLEKIYRKIINHKPGNPEAGIALAELYHKQGKQDEAITIFEEILNSYPNSVKTMHLLVELYYEIV